MTYKRVEKAKEINERNGGDKIKLFCNDWRGRARKSAQEGEPAQGDAELRKD